MTRTVRPALAYASRGWSVVPVHTVTVGRCSCGRVDCPAPGKHPRVRWEAAMHKAASPEQVASWWDRWPDANIAVVTGSVSGIAVLDVDPRARGSQALGRLERRWGTLPRTVEARSGGGGRHVWFAAREELPVRGSTAVDRGVAQGMTGDRGFERRPSLPRWRLQARPQELAFDQSWRKREPAGFYEYDRDADRVEVLAIGRRRNDEVQGARR